ncbi:MAG TPA: helix-hairpin-helix domain-containing protein [Nitrospirales bacterium]|nr:helix-hairpin-helix domain-containing protein [Nitrospirales bacterium]HIN34104.1 helix-hairpin-helix domain-containing protein [Nitrospirales bacterium]
MLLCGTDDRKSRDSFSVHSICFIEEELMRQRVKLFVGSVIFIGLVSVVMVMSAAVAHADHNVNVNTATVNELKTVPGIGKVIAERIVEYRENERAFNTVEDLLNVKGIGKETLEKLRDHVTVGEES